MSHLAQFGATTKAVDLELFKQAVESVARKLRYKLSKTVDATSQGSELTEWRGKKIVFSLRGGSFPLGVGFVQNDDGHMAYVGDNLNAAALEKLKRAIDTTYDIIGFAQALIEAGFDVDVSKDGDVTLIQAEKE